jgi:hypothetical protein
VFNLSRSGLLQVEELMTVTWLFTVYDLWRHRASFCFIAPSEMKHRVFVVWFHCKFNC